METDERVIVKYCFSQPGKVISEETEYYETIINDLQSEGFIHSIIEHEIEEPFSTEKNIVKYQNEPCGKFIFSFTCNEVRGESTETYNFSISFQNETHTSIEILYVEICSPNYTFTLDSESNCLEVLKHKLRKKLNNWSTRYCLLDEQSAYYASMLYPQIYKVENFFRHYVNDVFIKIFGANWWNEAIASSIRESRKDRIDDTREYAGAYKDIQPYLLSLELGDLMEIAKTKRIKWNPTFDSKIENALNHYSKEDVVSLLNRQCEVSIDIWNMCFAKHLSSDFASNYCLFEKRRNQVAHNRLLDYDAYINISSLCNLIFCELVTAHTKFCSEHISSQEQEMINLYMEDVEKDEEQRQEALKFIAEEESGVRHYSKKQILELFKDTLLSLYNSIICIFDDRNDLEIGKLSMITETVGVQRCFLIKSNIKSEIINISAILDINDSQGVSSFLKLTFEYIGKHKDFEISFINGEFVFNAEQSTYMPQTKESLNRNSFEETKTGICDLVEDVFPDLRKEADIHNHLEAMGKSSAITESGIQCYDCGEEYVCINDEYAPIGTCLNCGARNKIIYCVICETPIGAVDADDDAESINYCQYHEDKLFGDD